MSEGDELVDLIGWNDDTATVDLRLREIFQPVIQPISASLHGLTHCYPRNRLIRYLTKVFADSTIDNTIGGTTNAKCTQNYTHF